MKCLKTGFVFVADDGVTWNGDLFYDDGHLLVRGVNKRPFRHESLVDAEVTGVEFVDRDYESDFKDTRPGITITKVSDQFSYFMRQWNPNFVGILP